MNTLMPSERMALVAGNARVITKLAEAMEDALASGASGPERLAAWARVLADEAAHLSQSIARVSPSA